MMKPALKLVILFLLVFCSRVAAQHKELKFTRVDGAYGKPLGKIRNITQDPTGYMWFSGEDEKCIYRFDGNWVTAYRHDDANINSPGGTSVSSIYADDSGHIWIGYINGLDRYTPATGIYTHYRPDPSDSARLSGVVNQVLRDRKGRLWVGTENGLYQLDEKSGKFLHYRNNPDNPASLSSNDIWNIYEDRAGVLWIATGRPWDNKGPESGGLNRMEKDGTFTRFMHDPANPNSLLTNKVRALFEDSRGVFWVGTSGDGLHTMDRKTGLFTRHHYNPKQPEQLSRPPLGKHAYEKLNDQVTFILEDCIGSIWIGTMFSGISRYDTSTKKITRYYGKHGFPDSSGWNAYQSRDGVLWISTQQNNLFRVDPFQKTIPSIPTSDQVNRLAEDKKGNLLVGAYEGGLIQFDQELNKLQQFRNSSTDSKSLFDRRNIVLSFHQYINDSILLGTSDGPGFFFPETGTFTRLPFDIKYVENIPWRPIPQIFRDKEGIIWFCTYGAGLVRYNPQTKVYTQYVPDSKDSTSPQLIFITSIVETKQGHLWISGTGGIDRMDKKTGKFRHYLKGNDIIELYYDTKGTLWAGSQSGLYTYDIANDTFDPFLEENSLVNEENIISIVEDHTENLWLASRSAIIKLNPATKETVIYNSRFGIQNLTMRYNAGYTDRKGRVYFGHDKGFYAFYPSDLPGAVFPLKVMITDIFVNNQVMQPAGKILPDKSPGEQVSLNLTYNNNNVGFNFSAIDFRAPETIRYYSMMEGYDNIWREIKGGKNAAFFNIPPGNYVFRVKAYNTDGTIGEKAIKIHISPPWWKSWWAFSLYGLFTLLFLFSLYRLQKNAIIQKEREKQRLFELGQAKEIEKAYHELRATQAQLIQSEKMASLGELTAGIAHEIQNPLNFINNFSDLNQELVTELNEEAEKGNITDVKLIAKNISENESKINYHGKRADAIVKGMLQHSRSSSGQKESTDINALADEYLRLAYHGLRAKDKSFNASIKSDFDDGLGKINIIPQDIGRALLNIYNNAFYAVMEKKKQLGDSFEPVVTVSTRKKQDGIEMSVWDNGMGIPEMVKEKIFQPFFTTKPTGQGTGLGLSLSYDIIKAHKGEITVETRAGEFTRFIIHLPVT